MTFGACFFEERELWIVMEFMEGGSLFDWLQSELEITWEARLRYNSPPSTPFVIIHIIKVGITSEEES